MKKNLILLAMSLCLASCSEKTFYLDTEGDDRNNGSIVRPWGTPEHALASVQEYLRSHPDKDAKLIVRSGEYHLNDVLVIDGSSFEGELTIEGTGRSHPSFSGEKLITGWKKVSDEAALKRIPEQAGEHILMCDLKAQGITDYGEAVSYTDRINFYCNGKRQNLSRWPNKDEGFIFAGRAMGKIEKEKSYLNVHCTADGILEYKDERVGSWALEAEPCALGYWQFNWSEDYQPMVIDTLTSTMTLIGKPHYYGYRDGCRFIGLNLLCELDREGEYFLDRDKGILYWYAVEGFDPEKDETALSMFNKEHMLKVNNCKDLSIRKINFFGGRGGAIYVNKSEDVELEECVIGRFACDALKVCDSQGYEMKRCTVEELDCAGLRASGGDRVTLESAEFEVKDCIFKNIALFRPTYMPAINFKGCGMLISHNVFDGNASSALRLDGNDVTVEYNEFCNLVQESEDQGGIDMHNNISFRGIVIRWNYWHDIGVKGMSEAAAVRFDDIISGAEVYGNVFRNCGTSHFGAVQIHGGMDNRITGNVFFDCSCAVSCTPWDDDRWSSEFTNQRAKIDSVNFFGDIYKSHYPEIESESIIAENHNRNYIQDNLLVNVTDATRNSQHCVVGNNSTIRDKEHDLGYYLDRNVLKSSGIKEIPFKKIASLQKSKRTCRKDCAGELAIVAHRGYWNCEQAGFSQNSIASLRCAQEAGFWGSEMDVQLTSDDSLVVFHDGSIGSVRICDNPYDSISSHRLPNGEKIPSLDEYLSQAEKCKTTVLVFEIKETSCSERNLLLTDLCIEALKRHNLYSPKRVVFISFCQDVNEHLGRIAPEFMTETLWKHYDTPEQFLEKNIRGADLNSGEYDKDSTLCRNLKAAGIRTNVWTVDNPELIAKYALMGIDELTTDIPDEAREIIGGLGIKEKQL